MWGEAKQERLNKLRRREQEGVLTDEERQSLKRLLHELEQEEWTTLGPALERLREEQRQLQEVCGRVRFQDTVLSALAERQEDLLRRARVQLAGLLGEQEMLKEDRGISH